VSPHVHVFNERVRIGGVELDDASLCASFLAVEAGREGTGLTYFEFATLVALHAFRAANVEVAVLEVGLGGRLDAFNIVDCDIAVITSIGLDHQEFLGDDIEQIGREKAGVLRPGQRVVLGAVSESVRSAARELAGSIRAAGVDFHVTESARAWSYRGPGLDLDNLPRGVLAPANCALALAATSYLSIPAPEQAAAALGRAWLPGRMNLLQFDGTDVLLDVAHNPAGAEFLAEQLARRYPGRGFVAICGMLRDKDATGVVKGLEPVISRWVTTSTFGSRSLSGEDLARRVSPPVSAQPTANLPTALRLAASLTRDNNGIVIFGSFSVVEQARDLLLNPTGVIAGIHKADG
jgi:dihydrofolate synthase/folylpolyglutamate synthase